MPATPRCPRSAHGAKIAVYLLHQLGEGQRELTGEIDRSGIDQDELVRGDVCCQSILARGGFEHIAVQPVNHRVALTRLLVAGRQQNAIRARSVYYTASIRVWVKHRRGRRLRGPGRNHAKAIARNWITLDIYHRSLLTTSTVGASTRRSSFFR